MNAIRIRKQLDSETLYLPELKPLIGKTVEVIVREEHVAPMAPNADPWYFIFWGLMCRRWLL